MRIRRGGVTCGLGFLIKRVSKINTYVESGKFKREIQDLQDGYLVGGGFSTFHAFKNFCNQSQKTSGRLLHQSYPKVLLFNIKL